MAKQTDVCVCGHTRAAHWEDAPGCANGDCLCEEFENVDPLTAAAPELLEALVGVLHYLPDHNDALNYAAGNEGRVGKIHLDVRRAYDAIRKAKGE